VKKLFVILITVLLSLSASAGEDATNVVFVNVFPSVWTNAGVTTATMAVVFEFPSKPGTNPRLQSAPDLSGTSWRNFFSGEVVGTEIVTTNFPWKATWHLDAARIGTEERWLRVLYTK
jgi:hypothetical protein